MDTDSSALFFRNVMLSAMIVGAVGSLSSLVLLQLAAPHYPSAAYLRDKLNLLGIGLLHMGISRDKKWKKPAISGAIQFSESAPTKTIIFIRHGESEWNEVFNRGFGRSFIGRVFRALKQEFKWLPTPESVFVDSSLSPLGIEQASMMARELAARSDPDAMLLRGSSSDSQKSIITCSNLRRSIQTALIGLRPRLEKTLEKVYVNTDLQEVTFNIDGIALAAPYQAPALDSLMSHFPRKFSPDTMLDLTKNTGTKSLSSNGFLRFQGFLDWCFSREEDVIIVAGGHSLYLRYLLRTYLPEDFDYIGKHKKQSNCGVLRFQIKQGYIRATSADNSQKHQISYQIEPTSLHIVLGDFH
uniref:Uncharacterized protein n=1 Tax=Timspurckia oligopyrenoides TaxID=708627 RepID=A0A7S0ZG05_9RHOD